MDLTTSYPRSVKDTVAGVVMIGRTIDKAKAKAHGTIGEYHYNCPMDQAVFGLLGIDHEAFFDVVKNAKDDSEIEAHVADAVAKKSPDEIAAFNRDFLKRAPEPGSEGEGYFHQLRASVAPDRTDVTAWADLLDLDEKRDVPVRTAATV
jgi:hypothetical protein